MKLRLNQIDVDCIIGDRPDERIRAQRLLVDIELDIVTQAAETDCLTDTVDYAALTSRVRSALVAAQCQMLERAAKVVYEVCRADAKVRAARVAIRKTGAIAHLQSAEVVYDGR